MPINSKKKFAVPMPLRKSTLSPKMQANIRRPNAAKENPIYPTPAMLFCVPESEIRKGLPNNSQKCR
jgi:hypothetical protein